MKATDLLPGIFAALFFVSCGPKSLPAAEWIPWMENEANHLRQTKTEGEVTYILQYKNMDYVLAKKGRGLFDETEDIGRIREDAGRSLLFDLFITCDNGKAGPLQHRTADSREINDRDTYYHFRFGNDVYLEQDSVHIKPTYCIADKGSGLNNALAFSIGFDRSRLGEGDFRFVVNDTQFGTGKVKFLFKNKYIQRIPAIKTDA